MFADLIGKGVELHNIDLHQGYVKADGSMSTSSDTNHSKIITTGFISGGRDFFLYLSDHYFVNTVAIYDQNGNILCNEMSTMTPRRYKHMQAYSFHLHKYYKMRVMIVHNTVEDLGYTGRTGKVDPELDLTPEENPVEQFYIIDPNYFTKVPSTDPGYNDVQIRKELICSMLTDRGSAGPCPEPGDEGGSREYGVLYSDQNEVCSRVGLEVSPYTYLTACHNPRSVMHTEHLKNHTSQYGITYVTSNTNRCWGYYGACCSNTVEYVLGYNTLPIAQNFLPGNGEGTTEVIPEQDGSNLKPFDMICSTTHIWVITDIWKDGNGNVRFVEFTESGGGPLATAIQLLPLDEFLLRVSTEQSGQGYHIVRLPGNVPNINPAPRVDYMPTDLNGEWTPITYNDDVCTFKGDKTTFMWGDPVFINVQRNRGWENLVVKKYNNDSDQYEDFQTLSITAGNTYPTKQRAGDWIDVNLSSYFPYEGGEYGKYIAYCTGTNGYNLWDSSSQPMKSANNHGYWLRASDLSIRLVNSEYEAYPTHLFAYPCKPNTTYVATIPSTTAYDTNLLRLGWGNMSDLSFMETNSNATVQGVAESTTLEDGSVKTTITTGSDATYLFIYFADPVQKANYARATCVLKEQTGVSIKSEPTRFEVLAAMSDAYSCLSLTTYNFKFVYGNPEYVCFESGSGFPPSGISDTYRFYRPTAQNLITCAASTEMVSPDSTRKYYSARVSGEYGWGKVRKLAVSPTNLWTTLTHTTNSSIDYTTGAIISDNYRDVITIEDVQEGDYYWFLEKRVLSSAYDNERFAFYDSDDNLVGPVYWFSHPTLRPCPAVGNLGRYGVKVPAGATKIKMAILTGNNKIQVWKPTDSSYLPDPEMPHL